MSTATVINEAPLTADLPFDLGDTLKCDREDPPCPNEAAWLIGFKCCERPDSAICEPCRQDVMSFNYVYCKHCSARSRVHNVDWRRL